MGLPTGVEVKTEPVKSEETVVAATVEEVKPVVTPVENTTAATGTASAETTEAVEVQSCNLSASEECGHSSTSVQVELVFFVFFPLMFTDHLSFIVDCSPTGTNPD